MKLDSRILEGKRPLTCLDIEQAQNFVGKKCYLTNDISIFSDLDSFKDTEGCSDAPYVGVIDRLTNINKELSMVFDTTFLRWKFCIPCEWVKEEKKEPKYRPYKDVQEFFNDIGCSVGDVIHYRRKSDNTRYRSIIVGTSRKDDHELVFFCNEWYTMKELFDLCEVFTSGDWQPFGKKCEE